MERGRNERTNAQRPRARACAKRRAGPAPGRALTYAAARNHLPVVDVLLSAGARADIADPTGWTAHDYAMFDGHMDCGACLVFLRGTGWEKAGWLRRGADGGAARNAGGDPSASRSHPP